MRNMKDSGIEWIGEIPKGWKVVKVKHIFNRKNEKAKLENPVVLSLARSGVKIRDISNNEGQLAESYYNYNPVSKGDLLLNPMDLYSGANCSISNVEGVISPAYANLRAKNNNNPIYYDYYFKTQYWSMALFAHGKGVSFDNRWTLNNETLMNYFLPHPTIEEQNVIAEYINSKVKQINNIILKTKETIEEYKKYKQSVITEAVTKGLNPNVEMKDSGIEWIGEIPKHWNIEKMKYLGQLDSNGVDKKIRDNEELYKSIHYMNVYRGSLLDIGYSEDYLTVSASNEKYDKCMLKKGDVLFTNSSETPDDIGHSTVIKEDLKDILFGYHLMRFRPNINLYLNYQKYLFGADYMRTWFSYCANGITRYGITSYVFENALVILPPYNEQILIGNFLDTQCKEIDNIIYKKNNLITELEQYKKSLIYECVTGKKEVSPAYAD